MPPREDWIAEQLDRGIDVLITNPELVKTGLDLLEFPTIVFMQSGYNVYSLAGGPALVAHRPEAAGSRDLPRLRGFLMQMTCLGLMARKIMVSQKHVGRRARIRIGRAEPGR